MLAQGQTEEAISEFREALRLNPADPLVHANLGHAWKVLFERGHVEEAIADAQDGVKLWPNDAVIQDALAWMLATAPQAARRDGPRAVQWALQADRTTGARNPEVRRTLAAAYAAAGKFQTAAEMGRSALQLAEAQSNTMLANELRREIKLYESGHPFETAR
jgi:tetratricopeptide (TPR) repeat protein